MRAFDNRTYNKLKFNSVGSDESDCKKRVGVLLQENGQYHDM